MSYSTRSGTEVNEEKRQSSRRQSGIPLGLIPATDLPVCIRGIRPVVVSSGYFYEDVRPPDPFGNLI